MLGATPPPGSAVQVAAHRIAFGENMSGDHLVQDDRWRIVVVAPRLPLDAGRVAEWGGPALVRRGFLRVAPSRGGDLDGVRRDASARV